MLYYNILYYIYYIILYYHCVTIAYSTQYSNMYRKYINYQLDALTIIYS